jgi:vanillate/4-hydroxybenzoate decarboxylase subunit D
VATGDRHGQQELVVERSDADGVCPQCGGPLQGYRVLSEGGWFQVVKCQVCLHSVSREPWLRLGYVTRLVDTLL